MEDIVLNSKVTIGPHVCWAIQYVHHFPHTVQHIFLEVFNIATTPKMAVSDSLAVGWNDLSDISTQVNSRCLQQQTCMPSDGTALFALITCRLCISPTNRLSSSPGLHSVQMLQKQLKGAMARPSRGNNPASPRRTTSAGSAGSQPSRPQQSPALGTLLELQQGLEAPYQYSQVHPVLQIRLSVSDSLRRKLQLSRGAVLLSAS